MASVDLQKNTLSGLKGMKVHYDDKLRTERNHNNKDIQQELSKHNYWIGCRSFEDVCNRVAARTAEADLLHPPKTVRKDRVTVISGTIPCPKEIKDAGREDEFMEKAYEILIKQYGSENVHGMQVHKDEVHKYIDFQGGGEEERESLIHGHFWISPYAKWTEKGEKREGINGKNFLKKTTYNELNNEVDRMCRSIFDVAYMTGGIAGKKSVEQLKRENETIRQARERAVRAEEKAAALEEELQEKQKALDHIKELPGGVVLAKKSRIEQLEETEQKYKEEKPIISQAKKDIARAREETEKAEKMQKQLKEDQAEFNKKVNEAANRKVSVLKDKAMAFILTKGLWDEFVAWVEKIVQKIMVKKK